MALATVGHDQDVDIGGVAPLFKHKVDQTFEAGNDV